MNATTPLTFLVPLIQDKLLQQVQRIGNSFLVLGLLAVLALLVPLAQLGILDLQVLMVEQSLAEQATPLVVSALMATSI